MFRANSLRTKLLWFYLLLITIVVFVTISSVHFFQLPKLYQLESLTDEKDIKRIKTAFKSKAKELSVLNYDNSVWDDTYTFVDDKNSAFIESNFVHDTYASLGINGVHIYDRHNKTVWHEAWDLNKWVPVSFTPLDKPSNFVKKNLLVSEKAIKENKGKPTSQYGFTELNSKVLLFSATSIVKSDLSGPSKGNLVFWRFWDDEMLTDLQKRAGIDFTIDVIHRNLPSKNTTIPEQKVLSSLGSAVVGSYRTDDQMIFDFIPFVTGNGGIKFSYTAPTRTFSTSLLSSTTLISLSILFVALFILLYFFHNLIISPILKADKTINKIITNGDNSIRFSSKRTDEIGALFNLIDRLLDGVESTTQELKSHNVRLQTISQTDSLTKVPNRRAFDAYMKEVITNSSIKTEVSLLICDVDYFKKYNDYYGHAKGDAALKKVAQTLCKNIHTGTDFVARYGGEEFVIVLKNTNSKNAMSVANNLIEAINKLNITHDSSEISNNVTISIGIHSFVTDNQKEYMSFFELADEALYKAKRSGRNKAILSTL